MSTITYKHYTGEIRTVELIEYIKNSIDGDDYDRGSLEAARATADKAAEVIANLIQFLRNKDLINNEEIIELMRGIY